jgi:hypothetical protein
MSGLNFGAIIFKVGVEEMIRNANCHVILFPMNKQFSPKEASKSNPSNV